MLFRHLTIEALTYLPAPHKVTSAQLEDRLRPPIERLGLPERPIHILTGIEERAFWDDGVRVSDVATEAARAALDEAGVTREQVGLLINTSVSKDYLEPSTASLIHGALGLKPECRHFDLANACLGFLDGMDVAGQMIELGVVDHALVVAGESSRGVVDATIARLMGAGITSQDFWSNFATLTLGSGAVAMVLSHEKHTRTGHRVNGRVTLADTTNNHLCIGTQHGMITDSPRLLKAGVALARKTWAQAQEKLPAWAESHINHYMLHQVGRTHFDTICSTLGISQDKCFRTYPHHGNVGPAAIPLTLSLARDDQRLKTGDHVALMGIGSGINVSMMSLTW
jgi:3-oxoacyl-[acyl-carrier-protein] synthase III